MGQALRASLEKCPPVAMTPVKLRRVIKTDGDSCCEIRVIPRNRMCAILLETLVRGHRD